MSNRHTRASARKRVHGKAAPTATLSSTCRPFQCYTTRSVQMTHSPIPERWLHCWSMLTHQITHILSYQDAEPVSQHTDTRCEQTHQSSWCRRCRNMCDILLLTTIWITETSVAEHLGRSFCLYAEFSATHRLLTSTLPSTLLQLDRVLKIHRTSECVRIPLRTATPDLTLVSSSVCT